MKLIPTATAARTLGYRDGFDLEVALVAAEIRTVRIDTRNFVRESDLAEIA